MKTIYFGAGLDTYPYVHLTELKDWIAVDENGSEKFIRELTEKLSQINFILDNVVDNKLYFTNKLTCQTIIYYTNCKIPEHLNVMCINNCFSIYCSSYIPHVNIMNYIGDTGLAFIGKYNNNYYPEDLADNTLLYGINNLKEIRDRFSKFIYIDMNDIHVYDNWYKFLKKSKNYA